MSKLIEGFQEFWRSAYRWPVVIVVIIVFIIGLMMGGGSPDAEGHAGHDHGETASSAAAEPTAWTCSMHPQIQQPKKGKCPLCFMDLIPVESGGETDAGPRQLKLTPTAVKLASIQTAPVERRFVATEIRMVGKIAYDETRLGYITARVPGRLDRLYVDYTGIPVREGDHLVYLYSPDLITAQQELLQSLKTYKKFGSGKSNVTAAREKLKLWGLPPTQIKAIEKRGTPTDHLTIYSPMGGVVVHKNAVEGMYVKTGSKIYTIADLSQVWVKLDAYESDLTWIRFGQTIEFETEAYPGEVFSGRIAFIDPVLDPKTRTIKVRVNVPNPQQKLKPEMFVRAVVRSKLSVSGKVMDPELAGKWISPMHPEIIKDGPGTCDVCGMALVRAEELGYISASPETNEAPLVIPASAPLVTGARAVVYTAVKDKEGTFEGKEIVLGPRAGDFYLVKAGLTEGEYVVVNGAFKLDSDLQIQAKPSMMSPSRPPRRVEPLIKAQQQKTGAHGTHGIHETPRRGDPLIKAQTPGEPIKKPTVWAPDAFKSSIDVLAEGYFAVGHALSSDSLGDAQKAAKDLREKFSKVDMKLLTGDAHMVWMKQQKTIRTAAAALLEAKDIDAARGRFEHLTTGMTEALKVFGSGKTKVFLYHCPMAFDNRGAYWLQNSEDTRNPYFGAEMLICKDSVEPLPQGKK